MRKLGKKAGVIGDLVSGTGGLIIAVVVIMVLISTILGAGLFTTDDIYDNTTELLSKNFSQGLEKVSHKLPTVLLVAAVVLLFGVLVILVRQTQIAGIMGGKGASL
jgi:type III secretory pathway component EscU